MAGGSHPELGTCSQWKPTFSNHTEFQDWRSPYFLGGLQGAEISTGIVIFFTSIDEKSEQGPFDTPVHAQSVR
jgi:hypothetical protein